MRVRISVFVELEATNSAVIAAVAFNWAAALTATCVGVSPFNTATLTASGEPANPAAVIVNVAFPLPVIVPTMGVDSTCATPVVGAAATTKPWEGPAVYIVISLHLARTGKPSLCRQKALRQ